MGQTPLLCHYKEVGDEVPHFLFSLLLMNKTLILTLSILTFGFGGVIMAGSQLDLSSIEQTGAEMAENSCGLSQTARWSRELHGTCQF